MVTDNGGNKRDIVSVDSVEKAIMSITVSETNTSGIDIIIDEVPDNDEDYEVEEHQLGRPHPHLQRSPSMTIFMVGKTFQWISRAKIASWFKSAFSIPDNSEGASVSASADSSPVHELPPKSPKRYEMSPSFPRRATAADRGLTLEPHYRSLFCRKGGQEHEQQQQFEPRFTQKSVPKMMRSASGNFSDELTNRIHSKMMQETVTLARSLSDVMLRKKD